MEEGTGCEGLSDQELLEGAKRIAASEREEIERLLRHLGEIDKRRLYGREGSPSLFHYCTRELRLSESEAGRRVAACRAARKYPVIYALIRRGRLNLRALALLAPHLTDSNHGALIQQALGKSTRELDGLLAGLGGRPERPDSVRHLSPSSCEPPADPKPLDLEAWIKALPPPSPAAGGAAACRASTAARSAPAGTVEAAPAREACERRRVEIRFTADAELLDMMERAQEILRNRIPGRRMEHVLSAVLSAWLDKHDPDRILRRKGRRPPTRNRRGGKPKMKPRGGCRTPRRVPRAVQRIVYRRDRGRCAFVSPQGRRCEARSGLEFDHMRPFASGGSSRDPSNIRLLCRTHNLDAARDWFGEGKIAAAIAARRAQRTGAAGHGP